MLAEQLHMRNVVGGKQVPPNAAIVLPLNPVKPIEVVAPETLTEQPAGEVSEQVALLR